jgi:hypothetical protein
VSICPDVAIASVREERDQQDKQMSISTIDRGITFAPLRATTSSRWRRLAALRLMGVAVRETLFAYRQYEHLKTMGMPPRAALTKALDESAARFD